MAEQKQTMRRRPIPVQQKQEVSVETEENKEYTLPVDNTPIQEEKKEEPETSESVEKFIVPEQPQISEESFADTDVSDEEWEQKIAEARAEQEKNSVSVEGVPPKITTITEQPTQQTQLEKATEDSDMEKEIQRRVAEELKKEKEKITNQAKSSESNHIQNSDEEKQKIAEKNDVSNFVNFALGDDDDFIKAFERELDEDERPESERTKNPTAYAAGMAILRQLGQSNNQQRLLTRWIGDILSKNAKALKGVEKEMRLARITPKIGDGSGPKRLSGATARAAVISRMKGMFRVQLYNSGFWLDLRPPTLIDLDGWMSSIDTEFKELGRVLGGHAHAVIDVFIKQKFFDILPQLIQRSNFENYNDPVKLVSNISFHDYDTLLWALCCMTYKDGIGAGVYCTNPDCRYVDDHQFIDLRNICFLNTEIFNPKAMEWMTRGAHAGSKLLTEDDLKQYREQILGFKKEISVDNGQTVYELRVPTMKEFIDESASMVSKMKKLLNGNHDINSDIVSNQLTFHLYKMLTPWIKNLSLNDENGNLQYQIPDREAIYDSLDVDHLEGTSMYEEVTNFIRDTKLSMYSSTTLKCPKCGKVANLTHDNMFPLDMQYLFFCLSCHMLEQTGASY